MNLKHVVLLNASLLILLFCVESIFAQQNKLNISFSGGINLPKMNDINKIYLQGLDNYHEINHAYDLSAGIIYNYNTKISLKLGFNYLFHIQKPRVTLIADEGVEVQGNISYQIKALCPFLGIGYNNSIGSNYFYSFGLDLVRCMARLNDELPDADLFFDVLHGNSWGFGFESNIRRKISKHIDIGLEFGYRLLNIKKLKIDSDKYSEHSSDIEFTLDGNTVDLDFSGPLVRLLFMFKI